jgi:hypothetical protein
MHRATRRAAVSASRLAVLFAAALSASCASLPATAPAPPAAKSSPTASAAGVVDAALEAELREIVAALPGRYSGPANGGTIYHKIVRIDAPQFGGDTVFYHQISRDGFDSQAPFQQKVYVFDRSPARTANVMRSWVFFPKQGYANFERDAAALKSVQPAMLMNFPVECAIRWSRGEAPGQFFARVRRGQCSFDGVAFKQRITPEMTYLLERDAFSIEDILYGENGQPLFPSSGLLRAPRVTP